MTQSKYQQEKIELLKEKVFNLYKQGFTTRQIRDIIDNERSHAWVALVIQKKENKVKKIETISEEYNKKHKLSGRDYVREIIRERDNYTCQKCGRKWEKGLIKIPRRFDVHHKDCDKEKTLQYDDLEKEKDNLITLCHKCHLNLPEHKNKMKIGWFKCDRKVKK